MKKTITLAELEKEITPEITEEDIAALAERYRETVSIEDAENMVNAILQQILDQTKSNPDAAAEVAEWSRTDKMLFIAREVYTLGAVQATKTITAALAAAIAKAAVKLLTESEIATPVSME